MRRFIAFLMPMLALFALAANAWSLNGRRHVALVLLPAVGVDDLQVDKMPNFRWMTEHGAVGLMNSRTANYPWIRDADQTIDPLRGSAYLTLDAGSRCAVGPFGAEGYAKGEALQEGSAEAAYVRRNLKHPDSVAFQLNPLLIQESNADLGYRVDPGALGDLLHAKGLRTAVIGEADRLGEAHREGVLACMDSRGRVDDAYFKTSEPDPNFAFGRSSDFTYLERSLSDALSKDHFIVIDWGDSARLDDRSAWMMPKGLADAESALMRRTDRLFGLLRHRLNFKRDALIVVSPYPSRMANANYDRLTPILQVGGAKRGWLASPTTRRKGVVANIDLAPTVAAIFGITSWPSTVAGRPIVSQSVSEGWDRLIRLRSRLLEVESERRSGLHDVIVDLTFAMGAFALLFALFKGSMILWLPLTVILLPAAVPLSLFLLSLRQWPSVSAFVLALLLLATVEAALASAVARIRGRALDALGALALATFFAVTMDGLAGFPHMPYCILSYSLVEGARYYGIGNEYMGAYLAVTVLGATSFFASQEKRISPYALAFATALFALSTVVLAGPSFGAKFGGAVAAAGSYGFCWLLLARGKIEWKQIALIVAGVIAVIALMVVFDRMRGSGGTHVGRAFGRLLNGGWEDFGLILQRKASMNFRLFRFSPWSRLMALGFLASWLGYRNWKLKDAPTKSFGAIGAGIAATLVAAVIALLIDDAGVLAAATALIFAPPAIACANRAVIVEKK